MEQGQGLLPALFSSPERVAILWFVSLRREVSVSSVTRALPVSKGLASLYLNLLSKNNLLVRKNRIFIKEGDGMWHSMKVLLNMDQLRPAISLPAFARGIGLYGSWATGSNTVESDLDLWVLVDAYTGELELLVAELDQHIASALQCKVHSLILTRERLDQLARSDKPFYENLMRHSITLAGAGLDTA